MRVSQEGLVGARRCTGSGVLRFDSRYRLLHILHILLVPCCLVLLAAVDDAIMVLRISVLGVVELLSHHVVEGAAPEEQDLLERLPEVPVQGGVDDRVQQRVGIAQPEEEAGEGRGYGRRVVPQEGPDEGEDEEGKPADGEGAHDDAQGGGRLALLGQREPQLLVVRQRHAGGG